MASKPASSGYPVRSQWTSCSAEKAFCQTRTAPVSCGLLHDGVSIRASLVFLVFSSGQTSGFLVQKKETKLFQIKTNQKSKAFSNDHSTLDP
jgi:hypothetical protein